MNLMKMAKHELWEDRSLSEEKKSGDSGILRKMLGDGRNKEHWKIGKRNRSEERLKNDNQR